jgi:hypothetical protein
VTKNTKSFLRLTYFDSVLALHSFTECPHILLEITVVSQSESLLIDADLAGLEHAKNSDMLQNVLQSLDSLQKELKLDNPREALFRAKRDPTQNF